MQLAGACVATGKHQAENAKLLMHYAAWRGASAGMQAYDGPLQPIAAPRCKTALRAWLGYPQVHYPSAAQIMRAALFPALASQVARPSLGWRWLRCDAGVHSSCGIAAS